MRDSARIVILELKGFVLFLFRQHLSARKDSQFLNGISLADDEFQLLLFIGTLIAEADVIHAWIDIVDRNPAGAVGFVFGRDHPQFEEWRRGLGGYDNGRLWKRPRQRLNGGRKSTRL